MTQTYARSVIGKIRLEANSPTGPAGRTLLAMRTFGIPQLLLISAAAGAVAVVLAPGPANATYPPPDSSTNLTTATVATVATVPIVVRVPVDDRRIELVQMEIAALTGGGLVFAATRRHRTRLPDRRSTSTISP
jgi:hypothetical protein